MTASARTLSLMRRTACAGLVVAGVSLTAVGVAQAEGAGADTPTVTIDRQPQLPPSAPAPPEASPTVPSSFDADDCPGCGLG